MSSTISTYDAFEIHVESLSGGDHRVVIRTRKGKIATRMDRNLDDLFKKLPPHVASGHPSPCRDLVRAPEGTSIWTPEKLGQTLYNGIFTEEVSRLFDQSLNDLIDKPHRGLCIRFHFDLSDRQQADLARLPWELLFRSDQKRFLSQSVKTPIVRYLELPGGTPQYKLPPRLRILMVVSQPKDLQILTSDTEAEQIRGGWEQDNVEVSLLQLDDDPSLEKQADLGSKLRDTLRNGEFHVLHFIGHGTFDPKTQEGTIFMETSDRQSLCVSGKKFANWLINHHSLRLVVLNACSTGQSKDGERPFAGVAQALVRAGIPGVLAMQDPIPDKMANKFGQVLYRELSDGAPVEAALSEARLELDSLPGGKLGAWATPVLFQRTAQIIQMPPKIGPALASAWTILGSTHLIFVSMMFLLNRSIPTFPGLDNFLQGDVAAFFAIFFGLPIFYLELYSALEYCNTVKLPSSSGDLPLLRRIALRLPVAFQIKIQGRKVNENVYQIFFLFLFVAMPMFFQGYLYARLMQAPVWLQREKVLFSQSWVESFTKYVTPKESFLNDNYRIGSIDTRDHVEKTINNVTYFPFWEAWGLLLAEILALGLTLYLFWNLAKKKIVTS